MIFRGRISHDEIMTKLSKRKIKWAIDQVVRHKKSTKSVAALYKVTQRRIQQLIKIYKETGEYPELKMTRRPRIHLTDEEKRVIDEAYAESHLGARLLRHHIKRYYGVQIPHNKIHNYLKEKGKAYPDSKKQKKRKRCRYERKHSLSLLHADWMEYGEKKVIAYLDDSSRCILALGECDEATSINTIKVLKEAEAVAASVNGVIYAINTDRGSLYCSTDKSREYSDSPQREAVRCLSCWDGMGRSNNFCLPGTTLAF